MNSNIASNGVVVLLDETSCPSLDTIDPDYPIFLLTLLVCDPALYIAQIVPAVYRFKYRYFTHENVICIHTKFASDTVHLRSSTTRRFAPRSCRGSVIFSMRLTMV